MIKPCNYDRFQLSEGLFVCSTGVQFSCIGWVKDISLGGVSYVYLDEGVPHPELVDVRIFSEGRQKALDLMGIQGRLIYDIPFFPHPLSIVKVKRCGLSFVDLSPQHLETISNFLARYFNIWSFEKGEDVGLIH